MTTVNNAASFFSQLRAWGPTMMEEAAHLRKEVVEHPIPLSSSGLDLDASDAVEKFQRQANAVSKTITDIESATAGATPSLKQLARLTMMLQEQNEQQLNVVMEHFARNGYEKSTTPAYEPLAERIQTFNNNNKHSVNISEKFMVRNQGASVLLSPISGELEAPKASVATSNKEHGGGGNVIDAAFSAPAEGPASSSASPPPSDTATSSPFDSSASTTDVPADGGSTAEPRPSGREDDLPRMGRALIGMLMSPGGIHEGVKGVSPAAASVTAAAAAATSPVMSSDPDVNSPLAPTMDSSIKTPEPDFDPDDPPTPTMGSPLASGLGLLGGGISKRKASSKKLSARVRRALRGSDADDSTAAAAAAAADAAATTTPSLSAAENSATLARTLLSSSSSRSPAAMGVGASSTKKSRTGKDLASSLSAPGVVTIGSGTTPRSSSGRASASSLETSYTSSASEAITPEWQGLPPHTPLLLPAGLRHDDAENVAQSHQKSSSEKPSPQTTQQEAATETGLNSSSPTLGMSMEMSSDMNISSEMTPTGGSTGGIAAGTNKSVGMSSSKSNGVAPMSAKSQQVGISTASVATPETPVTPEELTGVLREPVPKPAGDSERGEAPPLPPPTSESKKRRPRTPASSVRSPIVTRSARKSAQAAAKIRAQNPSPSAVLVQIPTPAALSSSSSSSSSSPAATHSVAMALDMGAEGVAASDGNTTDAEGMALISEKEFEDAPAYLKFQVTREQLNRAVTALNSSVLLSAGESSSGWAGALTLAGVKESLVVDAIASSCVSAEEDAGKAAKTMFLCLHKLKRVKMGRPKGFVHLSMSKM